MCEALTWEAITYREKTTYEEGAERIRQTFRNTKMQFGDL